MPTNWYQLLRTLVGNLRQSKLPQVAIRQLEPIPARDHLGFPAMLVMATTSVYDFVLRGVPLLAAVPGEEALVNVLAGGNESPHLFRVIAIHPC